MTSLKLKNLKNIVCVVGLFFSNIVFAMEPTYQAMLVNHGTVENGSYKTIGYKICVNIDESPGAACSSLQTLTIPDPLTKPYEIAHVPLKTSDEYLILVYAIEKDNAGLELGRGDYLYRGATSSYCHINWRELIQLDNYNSVITCETKFYASNTPQ